MSNNPYDQGRSGGQPPSGPDYNEWWRGNQDYLKGLHQPSSEGSTGPLLGDDPNSEAPWPPPRNFNTEENSGSEGGGLDLDGIGTGCVLVFLVPVAFLLWVYLHPLSATIGAWLTNTGLGGGALLR